MNQTVASLEGFNYMESRKPVEGTLVAQNGKASALSHESSGSDYTHFKIAIPAAAVAHLMALREGHEAIDPETLLATCATRYLEGCGDVGDFVPEVVLETLLDAALTQSEKHAKANSMLSRMVISSRNIGERNGHAAGLKAGKRAARRAAQKGGK